MSDSVEISASSLAALSEKYQNIAHNLANANTAGFKRRREQFVQTLAAQTNGGQAAPGSAPARVSSQTAIDFSQGSLIQTGRPLDLALGSEGFFVIDSPDGPRYTRNGVFQMDPKGMLVDFAGRSVSGQNGPITVPAGTSTGKLQVSTDGTVSVEGKSIGKLRVVTFANPRQLKSVDGTSFQAPANVQPTDAAKVVIQQGYQENSNVAMVEELVDLISVSRLYEANVKSLTTQDERTKNLMQVAMG